MDLETKIDAMESSLRRLALVADKILTEITLLKEKQSVATSAPSLPKPDAALYAKAKLLRCPECGGDMSVRQRKSDGNPFFGCNAFKTGCRGLLSADAEPREEDVEAMERLRRPIERKPGGPVRLAGFLKPGGLVPETIDLDDSVPF